VARRRSNAVLTIADLSTGKPVTLVSTLARRKTGAIL